MLNRQVISAPDAIAALGRGVATEALRALTEMLISEGALALPSTYAASCAGVDLGFPWV